VAAHAFSVQLSSVFVNETSTDKVANTIPTAASMSTDLYGMATLNACREILDRIKPIRDRLGPEATLAQIATAAFFERIDLSAHGFYKLDNNRCGYDWEAPETSEATLKSFPENSHRGQPFNYFTQGVAATEVEIDILTGDHRTIRTDIIVDVGSSLNPAIDIGQIEGAFVQGMGWSTIEELIWGDKDHLWVQPPGKLFTQGPGTYKIPAFNDTPEIFNVTLMDTSNPFAIHSSRAVGEPPFFLGASVFFAIKDAIRAARLQELGEAAGQFVLNLPSTSERIRMSCGDPISCESVLPTTEEEAFAKEAILGFQTKGSF
jgi:xanthine dehydrogenase/oxidase